MDDTEIRVNREHTDYVEISRRLYEGQTIMENGYMEGTDAIHIDR